MNEISPKVHYDRIDNLRVISAIGIVLMHILANGNYELTGFLFDKFIPSLTNLVFLFMIISAFSMCCGYFEKIVYNRISLETFYRNRFSKVWPFFTLLCVLDLIVSPSVNSLYEVLANLTLCFGFIPNSNISVIGVGWFLGLICVFYMIFPFFCYLLMNKKRACISLATTVVLNYLCAVYFQEGRTNIAYSGMFFVMGGIIFLYKDNLSKLSDKYKLFIWIGIIGLSVLYYIFESSVYVLLMLFSLILISSLGEIRRTPRWLIHFIKSLSNISFEVYLSHMMIYRVVEKIGMTHLLHSEVASFFVCVFLTIIGTSIFSFLVKKILDRLISMFTKT